MSQSVSIAIFNETKDKVLLIQRRDVPVWALPGGGIDSGESPEIAACREALEETGCTVAIVRKIAEYLPVNRLTRYTHFYEAKIISGTLQASAETLDAAYFSVENLPLLPPPFAYWIHDALQNVPMIKKPVEGVSYWILLKLLIQHPIYVSRFLLTKCGIHLNSKSAPTQCLDK